MPRYISRRPAKAWVADDIEYYEPPLLSSIEVSDHEPCDTGLLDAEGNVIWRVNDPIGFRFDD